MSTQARRADNYGKQLREMIDVPISALAGFAKSKTELHAALENQCDLYILPEANSKMAYLKKVLAGKIM